MEITVSKPQKSEVTITIEVTEAELQAYFDQAAQEVSKQVKIDGFRSGKIPREVLEKHVGIEVIRLHAIDLALPQFYAEAVVREKVPVVARPELKLVSDEPFKFEAVVAILPEVKIVGYEKINIPKKEEKITEKEVNETLDYLRKQEAEYTSVDRAAKKGDRVEIDFEGFDSEGDVPLEGTGSKNHPVILGEGSLIPGFEEELLELKQGEEKTFEITFPKDYHAKRFQGKKVKFNVKVNMVSEVKLPDLDETWIEKIVGKPQTLQEFKTDVQKNLQAQRDENEREQREAKLFDELLKKAEAEVPKALIEEEIDFIIDRIKMDMDKRGLPWEQYLKYLEGQKKDLREDNREKAEKQVKLRLIIQHLCKIENLEASEEDIQKRIGEIRSRYPESDQNKLKAHYAQGKSAYLQVKNAIAIERLVEKLLSQ